MPTYVSSTPYTISAAALFEVHKDHLPCNFKPPLPIRIRTKINGKFLTIKLFRSFCTTHLSAEELEVTNIRVCSTIKDLLFWYSLPEPLSPILEASETTWLD
jgi:hypothetical protein